MVEQTEKTEKVTENKDIQATKKSQEVQKTVFDDMDKIFDQFLASRWIHPMSWNMPEMKGFGMRSEFRIPSVDIVEKDDNIIVRAEVPGIDKKDIDISLNGNHLSIKGNTKKETKEDTEKYHHSEISTNSFHRMLTLPSNVDGENIKATFSNGLLEVTMPIVDESSNKKIKIE